MAVAAGLRVGRYEVLRKLGQGGFGILYVGRDTELDREVALKFLRPEHVTRPDVVMRFLQEARSAAKINHSGIVTVFECGQVTSTGTRADGTVYIAMELLAGESLQARLKRERLLSPSLAIGIVRQMCVALQAAHDAGIVHRDLKPDNIFLVPDAGMRDGVRVKVLDFGVAKLADGQFGGGVRTHSAMMLGTPNYMSPEQCKSSAKVDHRSDIYAVGCILFELVCGRRPYEGDAGEQIAQHQLGPVPVPRDVNANVPEELDRLIRQMLAKSPEERPGSMLFVDEALAAIERGTLPAPLPTAGDAPETVASTMFEGEHAPTRVSERRMPRTPIALGAIGVIGIGVIAGIALTRGGAGSDAKTIDAALAEPPPTAVASTPTKAPPPDAAPTITPSPTESDVQIECLKLAADKKWTDLIACSDRLATLDASSAADLRAKGVMEEKAAATANAFEAAVRAKDAGRAATELAKIPKDSVYRHDADVTYAALAPAATAKSGVKPAVCDAKVLREKGEDQTSAGRDAAALESYEASERCAPDATTERLAFMAACRSKNATAANRYYAKLPPSTTTGIVQICVRNGIMLAARPEAPCDADALKAKAEDHLMSGMDAAALAGFEASMKCRPDASLLRMALMASCRSANATKAKYYYAKIAPSTTTGIVQICVRNGIQLP